MKDDMHETYTNYEYNEGISNTSTIPDIWSPDAEATD